MSAIDALCVFMRKGMSHQPTNIYTSQTKLLATSLVLTRNQTTHIPRCTRLCVRWAVVAHFFSSPATLWPVFSRRPTHIGRQ